MKPLWISRRSRERKAFLASVRDRAPVGDRRFVTMAGGRGDLALRVAQILRPLLGNIFRVPADRIYPRDSFQGLSRKLACRDFDVMEFIFALEDELSIEIEDDDDGESLDLTDLRTITVGDWVCRMAKLLRKMLDNREA
ncbi:MAG: hypothetical protein GY722_06935 [bacterium]|nr:hypothetical protein [bacterium]